MWSVPKNVIIAGHRGDPKYYPENTLVSFASAMRKGVDMIETDIHLTKDGKLILMHDHDTLRTTGVPGLIWEKTFDEIRALNAGTAEEPHRERKRLRARKARLRNQHDAGKRQRQGSRHPPPPVHLILHFVAIRQTFSPGRGCW